jgi:hypothetical protein
MRPRLLLGLLILALLSLMAGCVNSYTTKEGVTFVSRSTIFEPSATVLLFEGQPIGYVGGPPGMAQVAGAAGQAAGGALVRPARTTVTSSASGGAAGSVSLSESDSRSESNAEGGGFTPPGHDGDHGNPH